MYIQLACAGIAAKMELSFETHKSFETIYIKN